MRALRSTLVALAVVAFLCSGMATSGVVAHASGGPCNTPPSGNICGIAYGSSVINAYQPYVNCGVYNGPWNVIAGCNGSNLVEWGYASNGVAEEHVTQYGWTYSGTQDGYRYMTFGDELYLMPRVSYYYDEVSDGYWDSCGGYVSPCDFDAWQDYVGASQSPTAQMRVWVDNYNRPQNLAERNLESPHIGKPNCMGSASGTANDTITASMGVSGQGASATIGASYTLNEQFYTDGVCNANSDAYSTYMNVNWDGASSGNNYRPTMTQSALDYTVITGTYGPDQMFSHRFTMDLNYVVNWWNSNAGSTYSYDLFNNLNQGMNHSYSSSDWVY